MPGRAKWERYGHMKFACMFPPNTAAGPNPPVTSPNDIALVDEDLNSAPYSQSLQLPRGFPGPIAIRRRTGGTRMKDATKLERRVWKNDLRPLESKVSDANQPFGLQNLHS